ncbi:MAG: ABC transporter permease, partial [Deltaproteobacteria bacterium]|nr:ABC transporter permease [Deltaproteobacteria bacterium]
LNNFSLPRWPPTCRQLPIRGNIFPGDWSFVIRGIYKGAKPGTDESLMFFHYDYLNEYLKKNLPPRANRVGSFVLQIKNPELAAAISQAVDAEFRNSPWETMTETEKSFQLGFVAMTKALLTVIQVISLVVVLVILTVLANTMAMNVRERISEYVVLKTLGFGSWQIGLLVLGESMLLSLIGGLLGAGLSYPAGYIFTEAAGLLIDFAVPPEVMLLGLGASVTVGFFSAIIPMFRVMTMSIAAGLRRIG